MNGRILAVDDQRYFRELLEGILTAAGFSVETAASGSEALETLARASFDLVVTDLVMPGMSGTELVSAIKERDPGQEIILVTGVVDVRSAVEAIKLGATDYLLKPFDREALLGAIRGLLERRSVLSERDRLLAENIEYLSERTLYARALELFRVTNLPALCERVFEAVAEEVQAQGGVLWLAEGDPPERLVLNAVRGLVRAQDEPEALSIDVVDPALRAGGLTAFAGGAAGGESHPTLWVALRVGTRLLGVVRLGHKAGVAGVAGAAGAAGDAGFDDIDRASAEKLLQLAEGSFVNAQRFAALEQRVVQDPDTDAYHPDYLKGVARHEIEKANRFGRSFGLLQIRLTQTEALRAKLGSADFDRWLVGLTRSFCAQLRSTDVAAADGHGNLYVLLAETDGIGSASFRARVRDTLAENEALTSLADHVRPAPALGSVSCPADGSGLEALLRTLEERVERDAVGRLRDREFDDLSLADCFARVLDQGEPEPAEGPRSIVDYALRELARRPRERNLVILQPGEVHGEGLRRWLAERSHGRIASQLVLLSSPAGGAAAAAGDCTWLGPDRLAECPSFLVHFGDAPPFVVVTEDEPGADELVTFQSTERSLVEYLAFRLQRELGLPRFQ